MKEAKQARRLLVLLLAGALCFSACAFAQAADARYETDVPLTVEDAPSAAYFVLVYPGVGRHYCSMEPGPGNTYNAAAGHNTGIIICYRPEAIPAVHPAVYADGTPLDLEITAGDPPTSEVVGYGMRPGVFAGMRALSFQLPSGTSRAAFWFDGNSAQPAPTASPAPPSPTPIPTREPVPGMPEPAPDAPFGIAKMGNGFALVGIRAGTRVSFTSVESVLNGFRVPTDASVAILDSSGKPQPAGEPIATGDLLLLTAADGRTEEMPVIVTGDVMGTGIMGLSQLVRMSLDMREPGTLSGPYLMAGDFTDSGSITLTDLVREAQLVREAMG